MLEIELKAGLDPKEAARLARRLQALAGRASTPERLHATYFDTSDRKLKKAGLSLRVRREGGALVQTLKFGRTATAGFHQVSESETRIPTPRPKIGAVSDPVLRKRLAEATGGAPLDAWFQTRVSRRRWQVRHANGLVEVALDRGSLHAGPRRQPLLEAELELLEGSPEAVIALARQLLADGRACLVLPSKAERGALLAVDMAWSAEPIVRKPKPPAAGTRGHEAWKAILATLAPVVAANLHALLTGDAPEGPHQLRVSLRRLRVAIRMFRPLLEPEHAARLAVAARELGRIVAPLRDADVLAALFVEANPSLGPSLRTHVDKVRADVRAASQSAEATGFALDLVGLAALGGWQRPRGAGDRPVQELAAKALSGLWRRASRLGDRLAALDDEQRHELRKLLKKLRYTLELAPVHPARKAFTSRLKRIQEDLGKLNDYAVLEQWAPNLPEPLADQIRAATTQLMKGGRQDGDLAMGRACRHWRELRACPQPWVWSIEPSLPR